MIENSYVNFSIIQYYLASFSFWAICSLWYDFQELGLVTYTAKSIGLTSYADKLATPLIEQALDASEILGITISLAPESQRTMEDYVGELSWTWAKRLQTSAKSAVNDQLVDELSFSTEYFYNGFLSHTAREFHALAGELAPNLGNLAEYHSTNYPLFVTIAEQIDAELLQVAHQREMGIKKAELLYNRMQACSSELALAWKQTVYEARLPI